MTVQYQNIFGQVPRWLYHIGSHLGTCPNIVRYCTVNCIIAFLLYIQLFKENLTFKLHFVIIVLPCKQQNVTYIRFLNYMHLPLKRTSSYKNTHTVNQYTNNKNFETKRTYDLQLLTIANECTLHCIVLHHFYVNVCYIHLVKDGVHTAGRGIWIIDVFML